MEFKFKSLIQLFDYFKDEKTCFDFLESQIWEHGPACPHCGSLHVWVRKSRSKNPAKVGVREYKCAEKGCNVNFTSTVGTIFEGTKLPLRTWYAAIWLCTTSSKGISSVNLAKQLSITQKSAWFVLSRIREMFTATAPSMLSGVIEIDESFVGGKTKNMSKKKRKDIKENKTLNDNKTVVIGMVERGGNIICKPIQSRRNEHILPEIAKHIHIGSTVYTDEWRAYESLKQNHHHDYIEHRMDQFVKGDVHTQTIEGFWSILKRGIIGVYHQTSTKHLHRYCNEFAYRYNRKESETVLKFADAIASVNKARITYKELIK